MRVDARGFTFEVTVGGPADGVPVLLLHGFPQHSGEWDDVVPRLHAGGLRTYALDQRGYSPGARPTAVADYRIPELVTDVVAVLDALGLDAVHLVGHDWGAVVAWAVAARHPDRVHTLTAVSVPHPAAMAHALAHRRPAEGTLVVHGAVPQAGQGGEGAAGVARKPRCASCSAGWATASRVNRYADPMREPGALTAALNWYRAMSRADLADVDPVAVPTTYVWSDRDVAIGRTAAEACAANVTGEYRFVQLAGVSHWIPDAAPAPLAEAILARVGGTA